MSQAVATATATAEPPDSRSMAASCEAPAKTTTENPTAPGMPKPLSTALAPATIPNGMIPTAMGRASRAPSTSGRLTNG
jgi:hypothetical protein